jgi:hypothetical protein
MRGALRTAASTLLACGIAASLAFATGSTAGLTDRVRDTLTAIDTVPTKAQLDLAFPPNQALPNLSTIAQDRTLDVGVRVRAIHALAKYCPDPCSSSELAYQSLAALISETRNETVGEPVVLLRAALETIGTLPLDSSPAAKAEVTAIVIELLNHPSRDIRAAAARALRDLCNTNAATALRIRYTSEPTEQVKLAISEALRILGQCGM